MKIIVYILFRLPRAQPVVCRVLRQAGRPREDQQQQDSVRKQTLRVLAVDGKRSVNYQQQQTVPQMLISQSVKCYLCKRVL